MNTRRINRYPVRILSMILFISLLLSTLSLLGSMTTARAQDGEPPTPTQEVPSGGGTGSNHHPHQAFPENWEDIKYLPTSSSTGDVADQDVNAQIALGQPGFSLRYVETFGVTEEAYPDNPSYLNRPIGLYMDDSDNLYVTEEKGYRVLKYNSSGENMLSIGTAGLSFTGKQVFSSPEDVALDTDGNIWVADRHHRMVQYDSLGTYQQDLPAENPWDSGDDNTHFDEVQGVVFDSTGRMFVADLNNHRVQVYTFSGGEPVYNATIGETGVAGNDNSHFDEPYRLAVDSSDRLYVVDSGNNRVQRCSDSGGWACSTFDSDLGWSQGIAVDSSDNVYIADSSNELIRKCTPAGICNDFITGLPDWVSDVAVDSSGNLYTSDWYDSVVRKYNSSGAYQGIFVGTVDTPYQADTNRINAPSGVAVASDGSIYVTEEWGYRLLKLDDAGARQWAVGQAGVFGTDNAHFGAWWAGPRADVAIDSVGRIYVTDTGNHRVQIFNPNGTYHSTFGSYGTGNNQFDQPSGIAIHPVNGDIYVVDEENHRLQVYNSSWVYKATIGETDVAGSDGMHFTRPEGVAVDASGNVFVSDRENQRVQKCTVSGSSGTCTTFAGVTGETGQDFEHFDNPAGLAVDDAGRVYVTDRWNNRVQVFDSSGAYLTSISGAWGWGARTGELRSPFDVAVDGDGNVYVTDNTNHRVQKYAVGVPGWEQTNINGFGDWRNLGITALAPFDGQLYAGTKHDDGTQLWRSSDGVNWNAINTNGFGDPSNIGLDHFYEFNGELYAGTWNDGPNGGQAWRSSDGTTWYQIISGGFGDSTNAEVYRFVEFNDQLYASTWNQDKGGEIWRSSSGNYGTWGQVVNGGFDDPSNMGMLASVVFNGYLYMGTGNEDTGGEVWRSDNGNADSWSQISLDGFGDADNLYVTALDVFDGYLYASTFHAYGSGAGAEVWRCQTCDGSDWTQVVDNGFGNQDTRGMSGMKVYQDKLYFVAGNSQTGFEVWQTADGINWDQIGFAGFGDSINYAVYWDNSLAVFDNHFFIGTYNWANGGEIWKYAVPEQCADLSIDPPSVEVPLNQTITVDVLVSDVTDLYGVQLDLSFDPTKVQVVDDDSGTSGVQITPGTCPSPDFVVQNTADNTTGTINYSASSLSPSLPCDGSGVVASITFQGVGEGSSPMAFDSILLSNTSGDSICATSSDGSLDVISACTFSGTIDLQGRPDDSGATFTAGAYTTTTDASGYYELVVTAGSYDVTAEMDLYLDSERSQEFCPAGGTNQLPDVTLLGGDANDDCVINILDLAFMGARFGLSNSDPGFDTKADVNADGIVNILDLTVAGANFMETCPVAWP